MLKVCKGALCLFLITIKAPQSLLTPKVLKSHQKDEKAVITGGSVSLRLGALMQQRKKIWGQGKSELEGMEIMLHNHIFRARGLCFLVKSTEYDQGDGQYQLLHWMHSTLS